MGSEMCIRDREYGRPSVKKEKSGTSVVIQQRQRTREEVGPRDLDSTLSRRMVDGMHTTGTVQKKSISEAKLEEVAEYDDHDIAVCNVCGNLYINETHGSKDGKWNPGKMVVRNANGEGRLLSKRNHICIKCTAPQFSVIIRWFGGLVFCVDKDQGQLIVVS